MDFKKKLKIRLIIAIGFIAFGAALIIANLLGMFQNNAFETFGILTAAIGAARIVQYIRITKSSETLNAREIAETDERNIMLHTRARALAFNVYAFIGTTLSIILFAAGEDTAAQIIAYSISAIIVIYLICRFVISRKY